ncbi:MAG TPA: TRAP transporter small permease subunit [Usitatibacteraceae bacterium]|nr:TRAP transporter small permease subunit [Usitatibacteraceae bacterium]
MKPMLKIAAAIDAFNAWIGRTLYWLVLAMVLISAGNAVVRKAFNVSSNAFLEIQWYLFAAVFMLGAGFAFLKNAHVRIDFVSSRLTERARAWIDIVGIVVFLAPFCWLMIDLGWPLFAQAWSSGEMSQNAGGLIRWPVYAMIPAGFALLLAQAASELIKRIAYLRGHFDNMLGYAPEESEEEKLARELKEAAARNEGARA